MDEMSEKGIRKNEITYNIIIKWLKEGMMEVATSVIWEMEANGYQPNHVTYDTLINGYCKAGNLGDASKMMTGMGEKGIR